MKVDSSCNDFGDCGCGDAIKKAAKDFNDFWKPGWGQRKPKCRQALINMGFVVNAPPPFTPITCMSQLTKNMSVKCSSIDAGVFGGPPLNIPQFANPNDLWIQPGACKNKDKSGFLLDTIFHEALHACGAPPDAGFSAGQMMAYDVSALCLSE